MKALLTFFDKPIRFVLVSLLGWCVMFVFVLMLRIYNESKEVFLVIKWLQLGTFFHALIFALFALLLLAFGIKQNGLDRNKILTYLAISYSFLTIFIAFGLFGQGHLLLV